MICHNRYVRLVQELLVLLAWCRLLVLQGTASVVEGWVCRLRTATQHWMMVALKAVEVAVLAVSEVVAVVETTLGLAVEVLAVASRAIEGTIVVLAVAQVVFEVAVAVPPVQ